MNSPLVTLFVAFVLFVLLLAGAERHDARALARRGARKDTKRLTMCGRAWAIRVEYVRFR